MIGLSGWLHGTETPTQFERVGSAAIDLDHLLVGMLGGFQPDKIARAFEGDDDGFYARLCFAWPSEPDYRPLANDVDLIEPELVNALSRLIKLSEPDTDECVRPAQPAIVGGSY